MIGLLLVSCYIKRRESKKMKKTNGELVNELMVSLKVDLSELIGILYEGFVVKLGDEEDEKSRKQLENTIDTISAFRKKYNIQY